MKVVITALVNGEVYLSNDFSFVSEQELDNYVASLEKNIKAQILADKIIVYSEVGEQGLSPYFSKDLMCGNTKINIEINEYSKFLKYCKETLKYLSSLEIITKPVDENS